MLKVLLPRKCRCVVKPSLIIVLVCLSVGWVGVDVKPLQKERSDLAPGQSGTYYQLSDAERKELVWMAKAPRRPILMGTSRLVIVRLPVRNGKPVRKDAPS